MLLPPVLTTGSEYIGPEVTLVQIPASPILLAAQNEPPENVATAVMLICAASDPAGVGSSVALNL